MRLSMHKLKRPKTPDALEKLKEKYPATDEWSEVVDAQKDEIRTALFSMQGYFCAYCERTVTSQYGHEDKTGHIEHYRRRKFFPQHTFDWNNLFYSCSNHDSCGKHKDEKIPAGNIDYKKMIDPCVDNPEDLFVFTTLGEIKPREDISPAQKERAEETIRVFGLNNIRKDRETNMKAFGYLNNYPMSTIESIIKQLEIDGIQPYLTSLYSIFGLRRVS